MTKIEIRNNDIHKIEELTNLYDNVGWFNYNYNLDVLEKAFKNSFLIIFAWDAARLVGLLRSVGDGFTSLIYLYFLIIKILSINTFFHNIIASVETQYLIFIIYFTCSNISKYNCSNS